MNKVDKLISSFFISFILMASSAFGADGDQIFGRWSVTGNPEGRNTKVESFKCDSNYCGKIVELREPHYPADDEGGMAGNPKVDRNNPDPELRTRPLLGLHCWRDSAIPVGMYGKGERFTIRIVASSINVR